MVSDRAYLEIVESIYDAATDPALWPVVLEKLAARSRSKAFMSVRDLTTSPNSWPTLFSSMEKGWLDAFQQHYADRVAWMKSRSPNRAVGVAVPSDRVIRRSELVETEWYNDFLRPQGLISGIGVTLMRDQRSLVSAGLWVSLEAEAEQAAHVALLQQVTPHLTRALKVNRQLSGADFRWQAAEQCFNRLEVGVVLLAPDMTVQFANAEAERILGQQDGLARDREGRLRAASSDDDADLRASVRTIATGVQSQGADPQGADRGGVLSMRRRSGRRAYGVLIAAVHPPPGLFGLGEPRAVAFIAEGRKRQPAPEQLAVAFGLTPAESRLLRVLLQGHGLTEAAARLGKSVNTAKTHVRGLFDKLGCSGQADLVRTVMSHPVWLAGGGAPRTE
jgi:DNA-binding CsgD family transcriptional regulator